MKEFGRRICNLLTIKSIVTIILTGCFTFLAVKDKVSAEVFISVYSVVIGFYFGTQRAKDDDNKIDDNTIKQDIENS